MSSTSTASTKDGRSEYRHGMLGKIMSVRHIAKSRSGIGLALMVLALPALAGCWPSPPPPPPTVYSPPFKVTTPPIPADVPSSAPACPAEAPRQIDDQAGYFSACSTYPWSPEQVLDIYNLSDDVLDVTSTIPPGLDSVRYPSPDGLPDADTLVETVQDYVVHVAQGLADMNSGGTYLSLVPVGGYIRLTSATGMNATVGVDPAVSEDSYAAQLLSSYVIDNLLEQSANSTAAYWNSIAKCVNDAASLWGELSQDQDNNQIATTIDDALNTTRSCQELQEKLSADPEEVAHLLPEQEKLDQETLADLGSVLDKSAKSDWLSGLIDTSEHFAERHG